MYAIMKKKSADFRAQTGNRYTKTSLNADKACAKLEVASCDHASAVNAGENKIVANGEAEPAQGRPAEGAPVAETVLQRKKRERPRGKKRGRSGRPRGSGDWASRLRKTDERRLRRKRPLANQERSPLRKLPKCLYFYRCGGTAVDERSLLCAKCFQSYNRLQEIVKIKFPPQGAQRLEEVAAKN